MASSGSIPRLKHRRKAAWFPLGFEGDPRKGRRDLQDFGKDSGHAVCATVKPVGKRLGLLCYSEPDRYKHAETLLVARKSRNFDTLLVQPHPHFGHLSRKVSRSQANIYCVHSRPQSCFSRQLPYHYERRSCVRLTVFHIFATGWRDYI